MKGLTVVGLSEPGEHRCKVLVMTLAIMYLHREKGTEMQHVMCIVTRMCENYGQTLRPIIWQFPFKLLQEPHAGFCVTGIVKEKSVMTENVSHMIWGLITIMDVRYQLGLS